MARKYRITKEDLARRTEQIRAVRAKQDRDVFVRGGKTRGDRHAIEKTGVCGRSPEQMVIDSRKGGLIGGPIAARNPNSKAALKASRTRQHQRFASHRSNHTRRGWIKPTCEFCLEDLNAALPQE